MPLARATRTIASTPWIAPGERVGLLGSRQTVLEVLRVLASQLPEASLLDGQFPVLDDNATGWENIRRRLDGYEETAPSAFCRLGELLDLRVRYYSEGMRWRLGFTLATAGAPVAVLAGHAMWGGDLAFREPVRQRLERLARCSRIAVLAGDPRWLASVCTRLVRV